MHDFGQEIKKKRTLTVSPKRPMVKSRIATVPKSADASSSEDGPPNMDEYEFFNPNNEWQRDKYQK